MPKQAKSYAPRIPLSTWEQHRCRIKALFVDKNETLGKVAEIMKEYGLYASESQYERQLKIWGIRKNRTRDEWRLINRAVEERRRQGKRSTVSINGVEQSIEKIDREFGRSEYRRYGGLQPGLPDHIQVSSPPATAPTTEMSTRSAVGPEAELILLALQDLYRFWVATMRWILNEFEKIHKRWAKFSFKMVDIRPGNILVRKEPQFENPGVIAPRYEPHYSIDLFDRSPSPSGSLGILSWESVDVTSEEWATRGWDVFFGEWGMA